MSKTRSSFWHVFGYALRSMFSVFVIVVVARKAFLVEHEEHAQLFTSIYI